MAEQHDDGLRVGFVRLKPQAALPRRMSEQAAGLDLSACLPLGSVEIAPGDRVLISTGLAMQLPLGYEGQVRPRSGLALRHGITVLNSPGTIDADYRGEIGVVLINHGREPFTVRNGDRIAQLVIARVSAAVPFEVEALDDAAETSRGAGGYGSTGGFG